MCLRALGPGRRLGFRVYGSGFRVQGLGLSKLYIGFVRSRVRGTGFGSGESMRRFRHEGALQKVEDLVGVITRVYV